MKSNATIRAEARARLGGNIFGETWLYALCLLLGSSIVLSIASSFFIGIVLYGPLAFSLAYIFLSLVRGKDKIDFTDVTQGFMNGQFVRTFLLWLIEGVFLFLWSMLLVVPGIIKAYSYRLAIYIAADRPELSPTECITESRRMMDGHKWQAFCLDVSMFLWMLVGSCACGIGTLWVSPYQYAANAAFYEAVKGTLEPAAVEAEAE